LKLTKKLDALISSFFYVPPLMLYTEGHDETVPPDKIRVNKSFTEVLRAAEIRTARTGAQDESDQVTVRKNR